MKKQLTQEFHPEITAKIQQMMKSQVKNNSFGRPIRQI